MTDVAEASRSSRRNRYAVWPYLVSISNDTVAAITSTQLVDDETRALLNEVALRLGPLRSEVAILDAEDARNAVRNDLDKGDCQFVHDLFRDRTFQIGNATASTLAKARRDPERLVALRSQDPTLFWRLVRLGLIATVDEISFQHRYRTLEIEINAQCNFRCTFCPVSITPKPKAVMSSEVFTRMVERAVEYGHIKSISLNHYSEPTLAPDLVEKLRFIDQMGLKVRMHTNASLFTDDKLRQIKEIGNTELVINLPSVDKERYTELTGAKLFDRVIENLERIAHYGIPTQLSINAPREERDQNVAAINERFEALFGKQVAWPTDTRAGRMTGSQFGNLVRYNGFLRGCTVALLQINVSHQGKVFLCAQDFDQEYVLGDLVEQSLREVADGERARELRRWTLGLEVPPKGLLCNQCEHTGQLSETSESFFAFGKDVGQGPDMGEAQPDEVRRVDLLKRMTVV